MKKHVLILAICVAAVGCDPRVTPEDARARQEARLKIFYECLNAGPAKTAVAVEGWDKVVEECGSQSYYLSL